VADAYVEAFDPGLVEAPIVGDKEPFDYRVMRYGLRLRLKSEESPM